MTTDNLFRCSSAIEPNRAMQAAREQPDYCNGLKVDLETIVYHEWVYSFHPTNEARL